MRHVDVDRHAVDQHTRYERHHVPSLIVEVSGLDHRIAAQERLTFDLGKSVDLGLLNQSVGDACRGGDGVAQCFCRLYWNADLVEGNDVRLEGRKFGADERMALGPTLMVLLEIDRQNS